MEQKGLNIIIKEADITYGSGNIRNLNEIQIIIHTHLFASKIAQNGVASVD